ncbi:ESX secretion-associated protein EspG [Nocardia higoensis]|uniref:ESX secretion-associated protein EspG n=1 Tax=Nocardia higoensis TaxID=228599 RepID=UPI0002FD5203|nr:ESX secretion-associated protein EspG [Nocardia higoensis]
MTAPSKKYLWTAGGEQFAAAWFGTGADRMPFPLRFTSRFESTREYRAYQWKVRDVLNRPENEPIRRAVLTLAESEWRVELFGYDNRRAGAEIRAVGGIAGGREAVVAVQDAETGAVRLRRCPATGLTAELVALLPGRAPGVIPERAFLLDDLTTERRDSFRAAARRERAEDYHRFWNQPHRTRGAVTVLRALVPQPRRITAVRWIDTADGRYLETLANRALMIRPAGPGDMARHLAGVLARAASTRPEGAFR